MDQAKNIIDSHEYPVVTVYIALYRQIKKTAVKKEKFSVN